jgi:acetylglutamate kinase
MIRARKLKMRDKDDPQKEHDVGQVGEITAIDPAVVKALQDDQFIPSSRPSASARATRATTSTPTSSPASSPRC